MVMEACTKRIKGIIFFEGRNWNGTIVRLGEGINWNRGRGILK